MRGATSRTKAPTSCAKPPRAAARCSRRSIPGAESVSTTPPPTPRTTRSRPPRPTDARRIEFKEHTNMMTNPLGRITQGQFSYLPHLTDAEITLQIEYGLNKGYAWSVEYTDDPHPRNTYWEMFGIPMFDLQDAAGVMMELKNCRKTFPQHYIRLMAFDSMRGVETIVMRFLVTR